MDNVLDIFQFKKKNYILHHKTLLIDLALVSSNRVLSCSNDGQILLWEIEEIDGGSDIKANVVNKFEDIDYVYSLAVFPSTAGWASSGENTGIKIFQKDGTVKFINYYKNICT